MNNNNLRATSNLAMLEIVARKLGQLNNDVVYVGGCTTALFINNPLSLDVRPTDDVDCIVDIVSRTEYYKFSDALSKLGFKQSMEDSVICRWRYDGIMLDVMPTDQKILGFGNPWYKEALSQATSHQIAQDLSIQSITAPYFLATKIEAFRDRGKNDLFASHDFEDIITVIAGRLDVTQEIALVNNNLKNHLKSAFEEILKNENFERALPGHLNDGPMTITMQRVQIVKDRIKKIISL